MPGRRRGLPAWAWVAIAGGVIGLVALIVVLATLGGDGPNGPPPDEPFPTADEQQLLSRIPQDLRTPPCTRGEVTVLGARATVDCFTDTPQLMSYWLFEDAGSMNAEYDRRLGNAGVARETGDCAAGESADDSWLDPGGTTSGRLLCFTNPNGSPTIVWTHDEEQILAEARRPTGEPVELYEFWTGIADHAGTGQPSG